MIRLTRSGVEFRGSDGELESLRAEFERADLIHLPGFLEPSLLRLVQDRLDASPFRRIDRSIGTELQPTDPTAMFTLGLLLNSARVFDLVRRATGCARIASFTGRIYRRLPGPEYRHEWHDDITGGGRLLALSINLSREAYEGGRLELRDAASRHVLCEAANTGAGDAILFRIDPRLQHRIARVEGESAKTAMAGWFKSKPDENARLPSSGADSGAVG